MQPQWDDYEWDEAKLRENLIKHRINFSEIWSFDWRSAHFRSSPRGGESRYIAYGYIGVRLYAVVYTVQGRNCRVISLRKANPREITKYAEA